MNCGCSTAGWMLPMPVTDEGGTLRVELNHADPGVLPLGFRTESNDARILSVALALRAEGKDVVAGHQGHAAAGQGGLGGLDGR